ncbi:hypothetical protein G6F57_022637 [Rhizopus arrhizus]|nr:hypothetical protein G6F35_016557 [Rhizopus arrhizus]KAG1432854.1 hypothetical protein G6F57_022637 [Rhizopus arrhizus]
MTGGGVTLIVDFAHIDIPFSSAPSSSDHDRHRRSARLHAGRRYPHNYPGSRYGACLAHRRRRRRTPGTDGGAGYLCGMPALGRHRGFRPGLVAGRILAGLRHAADLRGRLLVLPGRQTAVAHPARPQPGPARDRL